MQLFSGHFGACSDPTVYEPALCIPLPPSPPPSYPPPPPPLSLPPFPPGYAPLPPATSPPPPPTPLPSLGPLIKVASVSTTANPTAAELHEEITRLRNELERVRKAAAAHEAASAASAASAAAAAAAEGRWKRRLQSTLRDRPQRRGRELKGSDGETDLGAGVREWGNPEFGSFDDFGQAMLLLLVMSTGDGWDDVM